MVRASSRCGLGAIVFGLLFSTSHLVRAEGSSEAIDLRYEAPASCPSRSAVVRAIHDRAPRGFLSADVRSFRVRIVRGGDEYQGRLEIERNGRVLSVREIHDASCEVVTTAVAVFVAIALDPAEASTNDERGTDDRPREQPPVASPHGEAPPRRPVRAAAPSQRPIATWFWSTGFDASSVFHPSLALGGRVHAELTRLSPGALVSPELRVSWGWTQLTELPPRGGEATFRFQTARAEACALVHRAPYVVAPCAGFELGRLSATTRNLPRAGGTTEAWYAPSVAVRPGWFLTDSFSLEADVGLLFPLTRASFVIAEPERTAYRIPHVAVTVTAGFRIWAALP